MALTREQYSRIMQVYQERQRDDKIELDRRQEEIERELPAVSALSEDMKEASSRRFYARMQKDKATADAAEYEIRSLLRKKTALLQKAGYPSDYLEMHYTCPLCQDTGYIGYEKCSCMKQLESEMMAVESGLPQILSRENFATFDLRAFDDTEPIKEFLPKYHISQRSYVRDNLLPTARQYVVDVHQGGMHNLFMSGTPGLGKTFMTNCIAKELIGLGHAVFYISAGELFELFDRAAFGKDQSEDLQARLDRIRNIEILIVDDLGTEFVTEFSKARLFSLINSRLVGRKSTIISSNLRPNGISAVYGERVASRILGDYTLMMYYGKDLRHNAR